MQSVKNAQNTTGVNAVPASQSIYYTSLSGVTVTGATASLDTTTVQFGKAGLKLVATGSTITVQMNGYPCTIQPNWQWIGSLYIQGSVSAITGTLNIITPTATYSVNINGPLSGWTRPYGNFQLTTDASATATMELILTGLSVGQTFWIEAWQLEPTKGTAALPSPYILTQPPAT